MYEPQAKKVLKLSNIGSSISATSCNFPNTLVCIGPKFESGVQFCDAQKGLLLSAFLVGQVGRYGVMGPYK